MLAGSLLVGAIGARAQVDPGSLPVSTTTPPTSTSSTAPGSTTTTRPLAPPLGGAPATTTTTRPAPGAPGPPRSPAVPVPGNGGGEGVAPPTGIGPFPPELRALMSSVKRTRPRNSRALVDALRPLESLGLAHDEALRVGMGRFPVAGYASYVHDWWFPRFGPGWRLHMGTDLFGAMGTPLRSPTDGVVRFANGGLGGIATYVVQRDGTYFYLAHLSGRPPHLADGQSVRTGDIVGYLGNSGNAAGGSPHLHFEVHPAITTVTSGRGRSRATRVVARPVRPGTVLPAVDPKPYLDQFLDQALADVPRLIAAYEASSRQARAQAAAQGAPGAGGVVGPDLAVPADVTPHGILLVPELLRASARRPIFSDGPVARFPILALAFLLVVMVGVLTPVLAPVLASASLRAVPAGPAPPPASAAVAEPGTDGAGHRRLPRLRDRSRRRSRVDRGPGPEPAAEPGSSAEPAGPPGAESGPGA